MQTMKYTFNRNIHSIQIYAHGMSKDLLCKKEAIRFNDMIEK